MSPVQVAHDPVVLYLHLEFKEENQPTQQSKESNGMVPPHYQLDRI